MSAMNGPLETCPASSVEKHRFDNISVKCVFKCKNPGYKTYSNLHKHYLDVHKICLHKVAQLDPDNEDEFRKRVASVLSPATGVNAASQRGRLSSHTNQPLAPSSPPQIAGPSSLGGYRTPSNVGQVNLSTSPRFYTTPIPTGSPLQNASASSRPPVLSEVGPSRSSAYHTIRHQPYPQSRPQQPGSHSMLSPVHAQAKGKHREVPYTAMNQGYPTPHTLSPAPYLEGVTPTAGPHNELYAEPRSSMGPSYSGSPQAVTRISPHVQPTQVPQSSFESTVPGNFPAPATTQEHMRFVNFGQEPEGSASARHVWHTQPQRHLQSGSAMFFPTPPMETNALPDSSPSLPPLAQRKRAPLREDQRRGLARLNIPAAPSRGAAQQPVSHPYSRPVNGSTTSELARQARENRRQGLSTVANAARVTSAQRAPPLAEGQVEAVANIRWEQDHTATVTPYVLEAQERKVPGSLADKQSHPLNPIEPTPVHLGRTSKVSFPQVKEPAPVVNNAIQEFPAATSHGQTRPQGSQQLGGDQCIGGTSGTGPAQPLRCIQPEKPFQPPPGHVERPQTTSEATLVPMVRESDQAPLSIQLYNPDKCQQMKAPGGQDDAQGDTQGTCSLWEGREDIKTPYFYLPETFEPLPFEDSEWW